MTTTKPLTARQGDILARLKRGETPKQIAADIGTSDNNIYQTRRRLVKDGHLPETPRLKSARKRRSVASSNGTDPVIAVLEKRAAEVAAEIDGLSSLLTQGAEKLTGLGQEASRLNDALEVLTR